MTLLPIFRQIFTFAQTIVQEAIHSRLILMSVVLFAAGIGIALFLGEIAITETQQIQSGILASFLRTSIVFILALFTVSSTVRDINDNTLLIYLSLPLKRSVFLVGKFSGYAFVAFFLCVVASCLLVLFAPFSNVWPWAISLFLELLLIVVFGLVCALSFAHIPAAFSAVVGFYLLSRSIGAIVLMSHGPMVTSDSIGQSILTNVVGGLAFLLPNLDRFTRSAWIMYGQANPIEWSTILPQTIIYLLLLFAVAFFDFYRKNF